MPIKKTMENRIKLNEQQCNLVALGAAHISYTRDKGFEKGLYSEDSKLRTQAIAENLYYYYVDAIEQLSGMAVKHDPPDCQ